jgi:ubiquinone/menaquinone biosynthesis C-methylase UbiE
VVEIAAGWGRNTAHLIPLSGSLIATDINADGIERMRRRFSNETKVKDGSVKFYANNGTALPMVPDGWATHVYSWDAMVHFADFVLASYVAEISRILAPGGTAFLHHSNLARCPPDAVKGHPNPKACGVPGDVNRVNPEARSVITSAQYRNVRSMKELVATQAARVGLEVVRQKRLPWSLIRNADYRGPAVVDCMTTLRKPVKH